MKKKLSKATHGKASAQTGGDNLDEGSPTYGWEGMVTQQAVGVPIPVVYGRHAVPGNRINEHIWTDGDKNYVDTLLALSEGEIDGVEEVYINDNLAVNFDGVTLEYKYGTNDQDVVSNFEDLHSLTSVSITLLLNNPYTYTSILTDVEGFALYLTLPRGLYNQNKNSGALETWTVSYRVEYKLHTSASYIDLGVTSISAKSQTSVRRIFKKEGLEAGQYDIRVTRTSADSSTWQVGDLTLENIDEIRTDDLAYPNVALMGVRAQATQQLSGSSPNYKVIIRGIKIRVPAILDTVGGSEVDWEDYYWDPDTSNWKHLTTGATLYWDEVTYTTKWSANPIWCMRDLHTNNRYGLGEFIEASDVDDVLNLEMAKYCEEKVEDGEGGYEKRYRLDVVLDSSGRALDVLAQLCTTFRGSVFYVGNVVKVKTEKAEIPSQLFGMGNIIKNSFSENWKSRKESHNAIEIAYCDASKGYRDESIVVMDQEAIAAGQPLRKKAVRVYTTKQSYAVREGNFFLRVCQHIDRSISFKAPIEAIACTAFDVISFSHDVPQIGFSGRIKAGGSLTSVVLDREVVVESGKTYMVIVRFKDDTMEEKEVANSSGTYSTLEVTEAFSQIPSKFDVYSYGESNKVKKDYRIVSMERGANYEITIGALEYIEAIYTDGELILPSDNYSALSMDIPAVTDLSLTEDIVLLKDGTIDAVIDVWFSRPIMADYRLKRYAKAKIYLSDDSGATFVCRGETFTETFRIQGELEELSTYRVVVVSVTDKDEEAGIFTSPYADIEVLGKTAPPSVVENFDVSQEGNMLRFTWDAVPDVDFARYIIKKGSEWSTGVTIAERTDTTTFLYPVGEVGSVTFMIKALDTSGNESLSPTVDTITVTSPPNMNFLNNFDLWSQNLEYKLNNVSLVMVNDYDVGYVRPALSLPTVDTWEDEESLYATWEGFELAGIDFNGVTEVSGYYEMIDPIDFQQIFGFKVVIDVDYKNVVGGSVEIQMAVSDDNITYSAFTAIDAVVVYSGRYVKFKVLISSSDTTHHIYVYGCSIFINVPVTRMAWFRDVAIPITGKIVLFDANFSVIPRVTVCIVNGVIGVPVVDSKTTDECNIMVYNMSGDAIGTAEVDIDAKGY